MDELRQEAVIDVLDGLYMWPAAKPGLTARGTVIKEVQGRP